MTVVRIGRIGRPHGLRGEVSLDGTHLTADELMAVGEFEWRGRGVEPRRVRLTSVREVLPRPLLTIAGVSSREAASELTNGELWVEAERLPDPGPRVAYTFQLIGCRVVTEEGKELGILEDLWSTGAHPIYVVRGEREWLLPGHDEVVRRVDLQAKLITVRPPAGIEDL